ncbi:MAG: EAL domain-containing protein, partial [Pseudomonadota bacterium]|nr:EAL domain-containing protein [Pseudomonadota bacterium]
LGLQLSEAQLAERRSSRLAACDSLTGLPNRARMRAMLDEALANAESRKEGCALFLIDLDRFKHVNDTLGHPVGDLLLKEVAHRLAALVGTEGQVGRLGGDEFEAVLPGIDEEGLLAALAERIVGKLSAPYVVQGHSIAIGASIGIAISRPGRTLADGLIKEADLALYAAKGAGRGTYRFFEPEMHAQESQRRILENDLRLAITKGELRLVFQPVVSSATEDLTGFEALVRWMHPVRGLLPPSEFLPLAEATGLIGAIGEWVVRTACEAATKWPSHLRLSLNLSTTELEQPQLPAIVAGALGASGLDPGRLELDLPEAALAADNAAIRGTLAALKGLGVRLALDDFGSDAASILSLKSVPLDRLKIGPSLMRASIPDGSRAGVILAAVASLADSLGMDVTTQGVETPVELEAARRLGCDSIQGFLFGRPMSPAEALKLAAESRPISAGDGVQPRPPRHSLIRRGLLHWRGAALPVRLHNISADGAMIESAEALASGSAVELDLSEGVRLPAQVRWSRDGRIGLKFGEAFDLQRLGRSRGSAAPELLKPSYLQTELQPDSPWAARTDRLTIKDVKRR